MQRIGVDLFLGSHGDEAIPYVFVAGTEGVPSYNERIQGLENDFKQALLSASPDFKPNMVMKLTNLAILT